jgi:hypothetical protein
MNEINQMIQQHEVRQQQVIANLRAAVQMAINGASAELAQQRQEFYSRVSAALAAKTTKAEEVAVSANA